MVRSGKPSVALCETISEEVSANVVFAHAMEKDDKLKAEARVTVTPLARKSGTQVVVSPNVKPQGASLSTQHLDTVRNARDDLLTSVLDKRGGSPEVGLF